MGKAIHITEVDPNKWYCVWIDTFLGADIDEPGCVGHYYSTIVSCEPGNGIIFFANFLECFGWREYIFVNGQSSQRFARIVGPYDLGNCDGDC